MDKVTTDNQFVIHPAPLWRRLIATFVIVTFGGLVTAPAVAATRAEMDRQERIAPREQSDSERYSAALLNVRDHLRVLADESLKQADDRFGEQSASALHTTARESLQSLHQQLREHDKKARADFTRIEQHLKANKLSPEILQRHHDAVEKYQTEADALLGALAAIDTAGAALGAASSDNDRRAQVDAMREQARSVLTRLEQHQLERTHKPFDPERMPFGIPRIEDLPEPAVTPEQFLQRNDLSLIENSADADTSTLTAALDQSGLSGFTLNDPADPVYLAATPDVQITPAIQQLVAELDNNPVNIRNWVHNHIDYLPTYGSIQGAQLTLDNKKGNAFDIASLMIALLRAADIPARYAYGTVELPIDNALNWLGNLESPHAAGNLLGQGGIPNTLIVNGGQVTHLRMEHIWVEAWVDFYPSRGAINRIGDAWVPMDASYKQYDYSSGMDLQNEVPFDAEHFANQIIDSAVINESEGWVQGINQTLIQSRMDQYRAEVEAFIDAQDPDTTVGDVLGHKTIIPQHRPILAGSLPMRHLATGARYAELPDNQRLRFRYQINDRYGYPLATFERRSVDLAGKTVAVSFRPATQADADLIASYLPEVPEGGELDPGDLPSTLPGYLINLTAEFTIEGELAVTGPTVTMGSELNGQLGYRFPNKGWDLAPKTLVAGEYQAIGLDLAGIAQSQLIKLKTDLEHVQTQLENNNADGLTRHSLTGNLLQTGVLSYFALNDVQDQLAARQAGIVQNRMPSFGTFATTVKTYYLWGMPRNVSFPGVTMDIDYLYSQVVDKQSNQQNVVNFGRATGPRMSALEHLVPEQLFSTEENPAEGISAVKAIALAQADGQRVYTITSGNLDAALIAVNASSAIEAEIRHAVTSGKEVTIHQSAINHYGWNGHGYIIFDPVTGAGAYKIGGGLDGGELFTIWDGLQAYFSLLIGTQANLNLIEPFFKALVKWVSSAIPYITIPLALIDIFSACHMSAAIMISALFVVFSVALILMLASGGMLGVFMAVLGQVIVDILTRHLVRNEC